MGAPNTAVQAISVTPLPSCTYANGTLGAGATLTASSNGAFPAIDGYTPSLNDALAINGQAAALQNGWYILTTVGNGSTPWVLTRRDSDQNDQVITPTPFCVLNGNAYGNTVWCSTTQLDSGRVGTDPINYVQQSAPAAAGGLVLLATQTASSSATLDFTSLINSTYEEYIFELVDLIPATNAVDLWMRVSTDAGSTWKSGASDYAYTGVQNHGAATGGDGNAAAAQIAIVTDANHYSNASTQSISGQVRLYNPANANSRKRILATISGYNNNGTPQVSLWMGTGSYVGATTAVNGLRFLMSSGNISSGKIRMYGVKK